MWLSISLLLIIGLLNTWNTNELEKIAKKYYKNEVILKDLGHDLLPHITKYKTLCTDIIPILLIVFCFRAMRPDLAEIANVISIIMILRMISYRLTIFPTSDEKCDGVHANGGCHDKMFSGHTALVTAICLFVAKSRPKLQVPCILTVLLQMFMSVATRSHYSVDVFIGALIAGLVYSNKNYLPFHR